MMQWVTLRQAQEEGAGTITIKQHWYLTEDKTRVVEEGNTDGRWLWASPGTQVKLNDAIRLGAVKVEQEPQAVVSEEPVAEAESETDAEKPSEDEAPAEKKAPQAANKAAKKAPNKAEGK